MTIVHIFTLLTDVVGALHAELESTRAACRAAEDVAAARAAQLKKLQQSGQVCVCACVCVCV